MSDIKKLYRELVNLDEDERIGRAKQSWLNIYRFLETTPFSDEDKANFIVYTYKYFVSVDKKASQAEYRMFHKLTGTSITYDQFFELTNHGSDSTFMAKFEELVHQFPKDTRVDIAYVGLCILASDDSLTEEEQRVFEHFVNETF